MLRIVNALSPYPPLIVGVLQASVEQGQQARGHEVHHP
jgi:hypothetical protein